MLGRAVLLVVSVVVALLVGPAPYLYYRWNLHWTAAAHRVVARTLARELAIR